MGQPGTYAVTRGQPMTGGQKNRAKLVAAVIAAPSVLVGILALVGSIGLAALANEKRVADERPLLPAKRRHMRWTRRPSR